MGYSFLNALLLEGCDPVVPLTSGVSLGLKFKFWAFNHCIALAMTELEQVDTVVSSIKHLGFHPNNIWLCRSKKTYGYELDVA